MPRPRLSCVCCAAIIAAIATPVHADLPGEALAAAKKATSFLVEQVSTEGGYLWRYSADLKHREGEGVVETSTVWVQPPGTPAVGQAFVQLFQATGDRQFLDAARAAAESLRRGQMQSGGWQAMVEFEPERRRRWAYRVDPAGSKAKDQSSLDDDKTQSALRFLIQLDRALEFKDESIHEMTHYGFQLQSNVPQLRKKYERITRLTPKQLAESGANRPPSPRVVQEIIDRQDERGAWLSDEAMRYHRVPGPTINMDVAVEHLTTLAEYLAAVDQ